MGVCEKVRTRKNYTIYIEKFSLKRKTRYISCCFIKKKNLKYTKKSLKMDMCLAQLSNCNFYLQYLVR